MKHLSFVFLLLTIAPCMGIELVNTSILSSYGEGLKRTVSHLNIPKETAKREDTKEDTKNLSQHKSTKNPYENSMIKNKIDMKHLEIFFRYLKPIETDIFSFKEKYFPHATDLRTHPLQGDNSQILLNGCVILRFDWLNDSLHLAFSTPLGYRPLLCINKESADKFMEIFKKTYQLEELSKDMLFAHYALRSIIIDKQQLIFPTKSSFLKEKQIDPNNPYFPYKHRSDYILPDLVNKVYETINKRISLSNL